MPAQLASPSGVAGPRTLRATYPKSYAGYPPSGCGPGASALLGSLLEPALRVSQLLADSLKVDRGG